MTLQLFAVYGAETSTVQRNATDVVHVFATDIQYICISTDLDKHETYLGLRSAMYPCVPHPHVVWYPEFAPAMAMMAVTETQTPPTDLELGVESD